MSTVIFDRGSDAKMRNNPSIDGLVFFNLDDNCIYLDNGTTKTVFGGKTSLVTSISSNDGASDSNAYSALAVKNGVCLKIDVADSISNIGSTTSPGRPVGCIGFKSIIGTTNITPFGSTVKNAIFNIGNRLQVNNDKFVFDYQNGKWGFNTSEERGADTFHPFNSTLANIISDTTTNNTIDVTDVNLKISATTDTSTTGLPIDMTTTTCAMTVQGEHVPVSSGKKVQGGIIHVFNDLNKGMGAGTHAHYILLDNAWRTAPNKTPFNDVSNSTLGLPFVIPKIVYGYISAGQGQQYCREDDLYYYLCTQTTTECSVSIYKYTTTGVNYDKGSWVLVPNSTFVWKQGNEYNDQHPYIGGYAKYVVYHGELHIFQNTYNNTTNNYHYVWSPQTNRWTTTFFPDSWATNTDIYATLVYEDKIYIFYRNHEGDNSYIHYVTYDGTHWKLPSSSNVQSVYGVDSVDMESEWVVYNGEIHVLGGSINNKLHIKFVKDDSNPALYNYRVFSYAALKYPFRGSMICVAPPTNVISGSDIVLDGKDTYDEARYVDVPQYIHYLGTAQANSGSTNYRKRHYQIIDTYQMSAMDVSTQDFIQVNS
jgi:hypothetical protein